MDLKEQLKELSFQMMLNETQKKLIENNWSYTMTPGNSKSFDATKSTIKTCQEQILQADKKGYELSLQFNELLLQNGKTYNSFVDGPDAANIAAENLLYDYGLHYPISWYIKSQDKDGLHFAYEYSDTIDKKHNEFLLKIKNIALEESISDFEYKRLTLAAEYYANHRKLLSIYHNNEMIKEKKKKSRH